MSKPTHFREGQIRGLRHRVPGMRHEWRGAFAQMSGALGRPVRWTPCSASPDGNMSERANMLWFEGCDEVVAWCLRNATRMERLGELEDAARWAYVGAGTAAEFGHSYLCSAALEALLWRLGQGIAGGGPPVCALNPSAPGRWLHVISMSHPIGGHTALARRWIARNPFAERHSAVLTFQATVDADPKLADAVRGSGGALHALNGLHSLLQRAAALRRLAWETADVVVLHTHWWDVIPALAFAAPGGPPVLLVNHADHAFWVGATVSDIVVDIRDSGLALSTSFRGARCSAVLPVPLDDLGAAPGDRSVAAARLHDRSVLAHSPVLLTIGNAHKYRPVNGLDFPAAILRILGALPDGCLIAVGPRPDESPWRELAERTGGRIAAVGPDPDLAPWHAAADLYLEGFPIGSYTALLEVALAGRAFLRKPLLAPPSALPIDRGALAAFAPPADPDVYVEAALALAGDSDRRAAHASQARRAVLADHCGDGWNARLEALRKMIPRQHDVGLAYEPKPMPEPLAQYWAGIYAMKKHQSPLAFAQQSAQQQGLRPRFDVALVDAMRRLQPWLP
jgi:hypothetical protein